MGGNREGARKGMKIGRKEEGERRKKREELLEKKRERLEKRAGAFRSVNFLALRTALSSLPRPPPTLGFWKPQVLS